MASPTTTTPKPPPAPLLLHPTPTQVGDPGTTTTDSPKLAQSLRNSPLILHLLHMIEDFGPAAFSPHTTNPRFSSILTTPLSQPSSSPSSSRNPPIPPPRSPLRQSHSQSQSQPRSKTATARGAKTQPTTPLLQRHFGSTIAEYAKEVNRKGLPPVDPRELAEVGPGPLVVRKAGKKEGEEEVVV